MYDEAAFDKRVRCARARSNCSRKYRTQLATVEPYEVARLEAFTHEFIAAAGKPIGELVHPLRVALTGKGVGLGLFDTLAIWGASACASSRN